MTRRNEARSRAVGTRRRHDGLVARVELAGKWLERLGFQPGSSYTVEQQPDGLLLRNGSPRALYPEGAAEAAVPWRPSYEAWLVRLRLERVAGAPPAPHYVNGPLDAYWFLRGLAFADRETLATLLLGARNQVLGVDIASVGSLNATGAEPREVYKAAIHANAGSIVLAHNHPSGNPDPSEDDKRYTQRLAQAGNVIGIPVLDHLVLAPAGYTSLRERGYL